MANIKFLTAEDFDDRRLNKSMFVNIIKGVDELSIEEKYPKNDFLRLERETVESWIRDNYETTGGAIVKGSFNDIPEFHGIIENMEKTISSLKSEIVATPDGNREIFFLEKSKKSDTLEKGKVLDSITYGESSQKFVFNKKGKEIKEKLSALKAKENSRLSEIETKLNALLEKTPYLPTEEREHYEISCSSKIKIFKYEMCYSSSDYGHNAISFDGEKQGTLTSDQTSVHSEYNDLAYNYRNIEGELKAIELLESNIEDNKSYELTARQMINFGF